MFKILHRLRAALRPKSNLNHIAAERAICLAAFDAKLRARDTRGQHAIQPQAIRATCAELALSVGRSPSAWRGTR